MLIMKSNKINFKTKASTFYMILFSTIVLTLFLAFFSLPVSAVVSGNCADCHTMHDSQDGSGDEGSTGQHNYLLTGGCVACHSSGTASTIVTLSGGSEVPIVFNTGGYPASPLAGGNFYNVAQGGACADGACDEYGHNVYGISAQDTLITLAEGAPGEDSSCFDANACHFTLAVAPQTDNNFRGGCEGCHYFTYHHVDNGNNKYRFLTGHDGTADTVQRYVIGIGDADWEQTPSLANHNIYQGFDGPASGEQLDDTNSISSFCSGCHMEFHRENDIGGTSSPWTRHPTDILLLNSGEYAAYNPPTVYNNLAPVAYTNVASPTRATAVVMCLSCHRPHGSDQPDILRWDYGDCVTGTDDANCGCFVCHTTKDAG
jgi:predicted CXXCH cytochrome family protein